MAAKVGSAYVDFGARTFEFERGVKRIENQTRRLRSEMRRGNRSIDLIPKRAVNAATGRLATLTAAFFSFQAAEKAVSDSLRLGAELVANSEKTGLATDSLQEYYYAAQQAANLTDGQAATAMQRFTRRLGEAAQGKGELLEILNLYNIAITDSAGATRPTLDVLRDLADATENAGSGQEQLRIAFKAFDSEGAQLVNLLKRGSDGYDELADAAHHAGVVISDSSARALADAEANLTALSNRMKIVVGEFLGSVAQLTTTPDFEIENRQTETEAIRSLLERKLVNRDLYRQSILEIAQKSPAPTDELAREQVDPLFGDFLDRQTIRAFGPFKKDWNTKVRKLDEYPYVTTKDEDLKEFLAGEITDRNSSFFADSAIEQGYITEIELLEEMKGIRHESAKLQLEEMETQAEETALQQAAAAAAAEEVANREAANQLARAEADLIFERADVTEKLAQTEERIAAVRSQLSSADDDLIADPTKARALADELKKLELSADRYRNEIERAAETNEDFETSTETMGETSQETFTNVSTAAKSSFGAVRREFEETADVAEETSREINQTFERAIGGVSDEIASLVVTGEADFARLFQSIAQDAIGQDIEYALRSALGASTEGLQPFLLGGIGGGDEGGGGLFGSGLGGLFGGGEGGEESPGVGGGIFGALIGDTKSVEASAIESFTNISAAGTEQLAGLESASAGSFSNMSAHIADFASRGIEFFGNFIQTAFQMVGNLAQGVGGALGNLFGGGGGGGGGLLGGIGGIGGGLLGGIGGLFGGFFADGGRPPLGRVSIIGERGPELFVPDTAGTVLPNDVINGLAPNGPSQSNQMNQTLNLQPGVSRAELLELLPEIQDATLGALRDMLTRGGNPAAAFGA